MMQEALAHFPWMALASVALMIFVTLFALLLVLVTLKSQRKIFERASLLPLEELTLITEVKNVRR